MRHERPRACTTAPSTPRRFVRGAFRAVIAVVLGVVMLVGSVLVLAVGAVGVAVVALEHRPEWMRSHEPPRSAEMERLEERAPALLAGAGVVGTVLAVDAIAHHGEEPHEPPVGLAVLGGLGAICAVDGVDYVREHGDQLVWPAVALGLVGLAVLFSDPHADTAPPASPSTSP